MGYSCAHRIRYFPAVVVYRIAQERVQVVQPPLHLPLCSCFSTRIYRERWEFYKLQRYQVQQQQAQQEQTRLAANGRVPLDGMYFEPNQFFGNLQRTQGGGRALAPVQDEEVSRPDVVSSRHFGGRNARSTAISEEDVSDAAVSTTTANAAAAAAFAGVGAGGRNVGGGVRAGRRKLQGNN